MMALCGGRLDSYQRVLGMRPCQSAFLAAPIHLRARRNGPTSPPQILQSLIVAFSFGVIAMVMFFRATDKVKESLPKPAAVEATQSLEVLFAIDGELALLGSALPPLLPGAGMLLMIFGMTLHSYLSQPKSFAFLQANCTAMAGVSPRTVKHHNRTS